MAIPSKFSMSYGGGLSEIQSRELGLTSPRCFQRRLGGSDSLVKRMYLNGKLNGHGGCVNTVQFNPAGDLLVSGSDDMDVILWDWAAKSKILKYPSGHLDNVFQALVMPFTENRTIVTSAADGQVRLGQIIENGKVTTKQLGAHRDRVHKLAIEPGSPHVFYSCGEDGLVQHFDIRTTAPTKLFSCSSLSDNHRVRLNSIVIDQRDPHYFTIGGCDEYARVYDIRNYQLDASSAWDQPVNTFCPHHLIGSENVHITGLAYSCTSELLVSYSDELIYLFKKDTGLGLDPKSMSAENLEKIDQPNVFTGHRNAQTIKGVSFFGPRDEYVASGSDCGHIYIWKKRSSELMCMMVADKHIVNCIESHPYFPFLASSGYDKNVKLWAPKGSQQSLPKNSEEIMAANKQGREARARLTLSPRVIMHILRLQNRQTVAYVERRPSADDLDSDNDNDNERGALILEFAGTEPSEEGPDSDPQDCVIC